MKAFAPLNLRVLSRVVDQWITGPVKDVEADELYIQMRNTTQHYRCRVKEFIGNIGTSNVSWRAQLILTGNVLLGVLPSDITQIRRA